MKKALNNATSHGTINVKNGWVMCPVCPKGKLLLVRSDTSVRNLPCKCKLCGAETVVNIEAPEPASEETSA